MTDSHCLALSAAVQALTSGDIIAYPTETVYGLGVDPWREAAVIRLNQLKGRPREKGFILLINGPDQLAELVHPLPRLATTVMAAFWPGPLTLLLPARSDLPPWLLGERREIAVRWSPHPLVTELLLLWQRPLISTSANPTGQPPCCTPEQVRRQWDQAVAVVLPDATPSTTTLPSTIIHLDDASARIIRPGIITPEDWRQRLPNIPIHS